MWIPVSAKTRNRHLMVRWPFGANSFSSWPMFFWRDDLDCHSERSRNEKLFHEKQFGESEGPVQKEKRVHHNGLSRRSRCSFARNTPCHNSGQFDLVILPT